MSTLPYTWDFDRRAPGDPAFVTFSIAVFQWQPKASGSGLKQVNACRICGYTADIASMRAKAQDICDRLNSERASVTSRPKWLQKQYSVPRPDGIVIERRTADLPGSVVRSVRHQVVRRLLLPKGFVKGRGSAYFRRQDNQIHVVHFQSSQWGGSYTLNLGFHYLCLRPRLTDKKLASELFPFLDCGWQARIGRFIEGNRDRWFEYGTDREQLRRQLEDNCELVLDVFDLYSKKWSKPERWIRSPKENANTLEHCARPWHVENPTKLLEELRRIKTG